jgi:hypothetical protein
MEGGVVLIIGPDGVEKRILLPPIGNSSGRTALSYTDRAIATLRNVFMVSADRIINELVNIGTEAVLLKSRLIWHLAWRNCRIPKRV